MIEQVLCSRHQKEVRQNSNRRLRRCSCCTSLSTFSSLVIYLFCTGGIWLLVFCFFYCRNPLAYLTLVSAAFFTPVSARLTILTLCVCVCVCECVWACVCVCGGGEIGGSLRGIVIGTLWNTTEPNSLVLSDPGQFSSPVPRLASVV